jgi:phosphoglycolate phosphatase
MWSGWAEGLADGLETATRRDLRTALFAMLGYDPTTGRAHAGGGLVSTPMSRLRDLTATVLADAGVPPDQARDTLANVWDAPDPVALAHPLTDLVDLLTRLRRGGRRIAVATSDDRAPTDRTLEALGIDLLVDATLCADDGLAGKPAPDMILALCARVAVPPARTAVVGDSPADIAMGRAAGAGLVVGVRTGVGTEADLEAADFVLDNVEGLLAALR